MTDGIRLTIEIDPIGEPISGRIWLSEDDHLEFNGYVELMAALAAARPRAVETGSAPGFGTVKNDDR